MLRPRGGAATPRQGRGCHLPAGRWSWPAGALGFGGRQSPPRRSPMRKLKLVQVGLGFWGQDWAEEILPDAAEVEVVGYVDPAPEALAALQRRIGVPAERCFASLAEALAATGAEAVLGTLRTPSLSRVVREALLAARPVIVEKPFPPPLEEAAELVRLAEARGRLLMVSQNYRLYPASIAAAELVAGRTLGRPLAV